MFYLRQLTTMKDGFLNTSPLLLTIIVKQSECITTQQNDCYEVTSRQQFKTDDGTYIHVRNKGIIYQGKDEQGKPSFYFKAAPKFEAPYDSNYAWLNHAIYVCSPDFSSSFKGIVLNVWMVR